MFILKLDSVEDFEKLSSHVNGFIWTRSRDFKLIFDTFFLDDNNK